MKEVRGVVASGDTVWAATSGGLFAWSRTADIYRPFTNADGLRTNDLTAIGKDCVGDIWVGTSSGFLYDFQRAGEAWRCLTDIASFGATNKRINGFVPSGDSLLICTAFGLCVLDRANLAFRDSFRRFGALPENTPVLAAAIFNDSVWVAVSDGQSNNRIAVASRREQNLMNPDPWSLRTIGSVLRIPVTLTVFNGRLYAGTSSGMYQYSNGAWISLPALTGKHIIAAGASSSFLTVCTLREVYSIDTRDSVRRVGPTLPHPATSITEGAYGNFVVGVDSGGCLTLEGAWTQHFPEGPGSNNFSSVAVDADGNIWGASDYAAGSGFYRYDGRAWLSFTMGNSGLPTNNVYRVSVDGAGGVWASTAGRGIVEMPRGSTVIDSGHIYGSNVGMVGVNGDPSFIATTAVAFDSSGQTWMSVLRPSDRRVLIVRKRDRTWATLPLLMNGLELATIADAATERCLAVDQHNNLWIALRDWSGGRIVCLNNSGRIDSIVGVSLTTADGLPSNWPQTIVVDRENHIWVGTDRGIGIILDPDNPRRQGGIAGYTPLPGSAINTIAVDSMNQKWVGTADGVIVLSPDGTEARATYTVQNTHGMLIEDDVKSIAINERDGTVYIGTSSGLSSLTIRKTVEPVLPVEFSLSQNYPNPFNAATTILYGLPQTLHVRLVVFDLLGREVAALVDGVQQPGPHQATFNGAALASGVYFYQLRAGGLVQTRRLLLLK